MFTLIGRAALTRLSAGTLTKLAPMLQKEAVLSSD
jgi:hypothetical protein